MPSSELQREFLNEPGKAACSPGATSTPSSSATTPSSSGSPACDVETKETNRFDVAKKTVEVANRAMGQR
jgi:hypothetical protein